MLSTCTSVKPLVSWRHCNWRSFCAGVALDAFIVAAVRHKLWSCGRLSPGEHCVGAGGWSMVLTCALVFVLGPAGPISFDIS